jgi:DNA-binding HxlR family transcriptional regulator
MVVPWSSRSSSWAASGGPSSSRGCKEAPHRYGELRKKIPGLSDKVLTQRLRELESRGLVVKKRVAKDRAAQAYALTARGESLRPVLDALYGWGAKTAPEFKVRIGPAKPVR